uniref:Uncharacterized protein n=1 Tax=Magnetococcus massalia (strain MO-1) TaxID=451514 RepID=A0A1S7LL72_MAGMO|nr:protein of unknown function [Candidatus Magnetococcus massalia]
MYNGLQEIGNTLLKSLQKMKPKKRKIEAQGDLFHMRLEMICDPDHELMQLSRRIDWDGLCDYYEPLYAEGGRPAYLFG